MASEHVIQKLLAKAFQEPFGVDIERLKEKFAGYLNILEIIDFNVRKGESYFPRRLQEMQRIGPILHNEDGAITIDELDVLFAGDIAELKNRGKYD